MLFDADTGALTALNSQGGAALAWASAGLSCEQIGRRLAARYQVSAERAAVDAARVLAHLAHRGFVCARHVGSEPLRLSRLPSLADGPLELDLNLTGACNASCGYCSYAREMRSRRDLPTRAWLKFFGELGGLPTRRVCLSGGEVFLRPDFWELLDALLERPVRYSVLTNGSLLDRAAVERLCEGRRRLRMESIQVSLDGSCPAVHERSRGRGTFAPAVRALRLLREAGLPVTCRLTANRYNVRDLDAAARLILEEIEVRTLSTNEAAPQGAGFDNRDTLGLLPSQRAQAMKTLCALARRYPGRVAAMAGPLANARMFAAMRRQKTAGKAADPQAGRLTACGCVFSRLAVLHDGDIVPCSLLPALRMGRINRERITDIWKRHPHLRALRRRRAIPLRRVAGCEDCEWAPYCNGGCPALAYELTGDLNRASPAECYRRFLQETAHAAG